MQSRPCQAHTEPQRPSLPPLQAPTYALKVSVVRAKNLLAKDPNGERGAARSGAPGWGVVQVSGDAPAETQEQGSLQPGWTRAGRADTSDRDRARAGGQSRGEGSTV